MHSQAISKNTQLFERLETTWVFEPDPPQTAVLGTLAPRSVTAAGACYASIRVEFAFRSAIYAQTSQLFLDEVAGAMLGAFEKRCRVVAQAQAATAAATTLGPSWRAPAGRIGSLSAAGTETVYKPDLPRPILAGKSSSSSKTAAIQSASQYSVSAARLLASSSLAAKPSPPGPAAPIASPTRPSSVQVREPSASRNQRQKRFAPAPLPPSDSWW